MKNIIEYIKEKSLDNCKIGIVLGSGLDSFCNKLNAPNHIKYSNIPNFRSTSIAGHKGEFVVGKLHEKPIICANGRFHYYEGYNYNDVAIIIDVFKKMGCHTVIMTNSSGCVVQDWNVGDLMLINGHLDYSFRYSNNNPNVIKDSRYNLSTLNKIKKCANDLGITLREGTYTWTIGPTYETPSEINDIEKLGGHAVGMSGLPEIERIHNLGMKMIGLCCLTNYASGISKIELTHTEVVSIAKKSQSHFLRLLNSIIKDI
jgi:purine-nucleoside phosphorylase